MTEPKIELREILLKLWRGRRPIILVTVVGSLLGYLVQRSGLTLGLDRMLGTVFGLVRGAVIVGFAVMLAAAAGMQDESWWKRSRLMPIGQEMASILRGYVETGRRAIEDAVEASI